MRVSGRSDAASSVPLAIALMGLGLFAPVSAGGAERCDSSTVLAIVGMDTRDETILLAHGEEIVVVDVGAGRAWREARPPVFAGSKAPGPVLAAQACGTECVEIVERSADGRWRRLGEPLGGSAPSLLYTGRSTDGAAWIVVARDAGRPGVLAVEAARLEGQRWTWVGSAAARAVGSTGIVPDPESEDGISIGGVRFGPEGPPRHWIVDLPSTEGDRGELFRAEGGGALHLGPDGTLSRRTGRGHGWREVRWLPWVEGEGDLGWRPGVEYLVEAPQGSVGVPPGLVWVDRRRPREPVLYLVEHAASGHRVLGSTPDGILTTSDRRIPYSHIVRFEGGRWALVTGCVGLEGGVGVALRLVEPGEGLRPPEVIPIGK